VGYEANKEQAQNIFSEIQTKAGKDSKTKVSFEGAEGWFSDEE
jgi:hypothetical protein